MGLKGLVVKTHGSSKAIEVKNSIIQCVSLYKNRRSMRKYRENQLMSRKEDRKRRIDQER